MCVHVCVHVCVCVHMCVHVCLCVAVALLAFSMFRSCSSLQKKKIMFVTALRTICLTVGVIAGKMERVTEGIYSDVRVGVGAEDSVWEQWAALLGISVCLMTIRFPSSLVLFFLDGMFDYLSEGEGSS